VPSDLFSPRKIGVCGSSQGLTSEAAEFCQALGRRLARDPLARIVSGGTKRRPETGPHNFAADWLIVSAARDVLGEAAELDRIVTVVADKPSSSEYFVIGAKQRARGKTSEARRISFVRGVDALVAVAGRGGTDQELALAIEHHIPVLPVPSFYGKAREFWDAYRPDLIAALRIDENVASRWEASPPTAPEDLQALANEMVDVLFQSLPRRCFVIMPFHDDFDALFDFVIAPAVRAAGDEPIRLDRLRTPGNVSRQIEDGLKTCEYVIAVLDNLRANVLYELGIAHGREKPAILLNKKGTVEAAGFVPFDISFQQRTEYTKLDAGLLATLKSAIAAIPNRST
jgi:predicted Rossmann-fold nucleotide-binding protein